MNITASVTKETLVQEIKKSLSKLRKISTKKAKDLADSISYACNMYKKDATKVTKKDLVDLMNQADKMLALPASASSKKEEPKKAGLKPTGKKVAEEAKKESLVKPAPKGKKKTEEEPKKPTGKKKEEPVKEEKKEVKKELFPETISLDTEDGEVEYTRTDVSSMEELCDILSDEDTDAVVAFYWSSKDVKKDYPKVTDNMKALKSFDNDLDLAIPVYVSDEKELAYFVSLYTEAYYDVLKYEVTDDEEMYAGGRPFILYVAQ